MDAKESLSDSLEVYKAQLSQINETLKITPCGQDYDNLLSLKNDIEELLKLTQDNIDSLNTSEPNQTIDDASPDEDDDDPFSKEYALFKAELENLNSESRDETNVTSGNDIGDEDDIEEEGISCIQDELQALMGSKCRAPYVDKSASVTYYNALISGIQMEETLSDIEHIKVRVLFINPTEKKMIPCPYFLDDKCKFIEENCNFSHGYLVSFDQLKEYVEPDFTNLKPGCRVLAKLPNINIWTSTVVEDIGSNGKCIVKHGKVFSEIPMCDVLPPIDSSTKGEDDNQEGIGSSIGDDDDDGRLGDGRESVWSPLAEEQHREAMIDLSLTREQSTEQLGQWEQFTKGIGSKLMAKMGYIVGTGLGKSGEGILQPVEPVILPAGKSLDHCMNLKEASGGSNNLLTVEKMQKKLAAKVIAKSKRQYFKHRKQDKGIFNFINTTIRTAPNSTSTKYTTKNVIKNLQTINDRQLNIERFKLSEYMKQSERNIIILKKSIQSIDAHRGDTSAQNSVATRLDMQQRELIALKHYDNRLEREQLKRTTKKKMTVF